MTTPAKQDMQLQQQSMDGTGKTGLNWQPDAVERWCRKYCIVI